MIATLGINSAKLGLIRTIPPLQYHIRCHCKSVCDAFRSEVVTLKEVTGDGKGEHEEKKDENSNVE